MENDKNKIPSIFQKSEIESKRKELEKELEIQKKRFFEATQKSTNIMQQDLLLTNWVREYPIETSLCLLFAGFMTSIILYPKEFRNSAESELE